ncbi:30316_t:CDS:2, partial [Gigaspora margarita]
SYDFWKHLCNSLEFDEPIPQLQKYKTYHSIFLKNVHQLYTMCQQDFGERQILIEQINFKLDILQDYFDILDPLVDFSIVEGAGLKLC